ncbi:uncharacterized protein LOC119577982 [Penaeus monodon]|uniref:uncharacterized protein LOC119577982 n=1 Tax=Penaeus monodon TaxID=6687 RepID=UPI0018A71681|nr:uncharacterized protein LOC119577982 [Penaeus monodon]
MKEVGNSKSPGIDEMTAELIGNAGESVEYFFYKLCTGMWNEGRWPEDWVKSVFAPIPEKGDALQCSNNGTIALVGHSSKKFVGKIIAKEMKFDVKRGNCSEQAGFRLDKGYRVQILKFEIDHREKQKTSKKTCTCVSSIMLKAFDTRCLEEILKRTVELEDTKYKSEGTHIPKPNVKTI